MSKWLIPASSAQDTDSAATCSSQVHRLASSVDQHRTVVAGAARSDGIPWRLLLLATRLPHRVRSERRWNAFPGCRGGGLAGGGIQDAALREVDRLGGLPVEWHPARPPGQHGHPRPAGAGILLEQITMIAMSRCSDSAELTADALRDDVTGSQLAFGDGDVEAATPALSSPKSGGVGDEGRLRCHAGRRGGAGRWGVVGAGGIRAGTGTADQQQASGGTVPMPECIWLHAVGEPRAAFGLRCGMPLPVCTKITLDAHRLAQFHRIDDHGHRGAAPLTKVSGRVETPRTQAMILRSAPIRLPSMRPGEHLRCAVQPREQASQS